uniref:Uncharacterized protein n=1 Tax=Oryza barthii TaxID=65489 RepID=A0A0D3H9U0_9ORYZ
MSDLAAERRYKEEHRKLMAYGMADVWARDLMDKATEARWRVDLASSVWVILLCVAACLALGRRYKEEHRKLMAYGMADVWARDLMDKATEARWRVDLASSVWVILLCVAACLALGDVLAKAQDVFNQARVSWPLPVYCFKKPSTNLYPDNMGPITIKLTVPSVDTYNTSTVTSSVATDNTSTITSSTIVHPHTLPL